MEVTNFTVCTLTVPVPSLDKREGYDNHLCYDAVSSNNNSVICLLGAFSSSSNFSSFCPLFCPTVVVYLLRAFRPHHFVLSLLILSSSPPHQYVLSLTAPHDCVFSFLFLAPDFPLQISLTFSRIPNQIPSSLNLAIFLVPKENRLSNTSAPSIGGDLAPSLGGRKNFADQCSEWPIFMKKFLFYTQNLWGLF